MWAPVDCVCSDSEPSWLIPLFAVLSVEPFNDALDLDRVRRAPVPLRQMAGVQLVAVDHCRETQERGRQEACAEGVFNTKLVAEQDIAKCENERFCRVEIVRPRFNRRILPG